MTNIEYLIKLILISLIIYIFHWCKIGLEVSIKNFCTYYIIHTKKEWPVQSLAIGATSIAHCFFYQIEPLKNGPFLILPSSIAKKSSAPEAKIFF